MHAADVTLRAHNRMFDTHRSKLIIITSGFVCLFWSSRKCQMQIQVAVPSKARVCGRSFVGVADSTPAGGMDICVVCVVNKDKMQDNEDKETSTDEVQTEYKKIQKKIPPGIWMYFFCECCVLSGRGLCDWPIPRPEDLPTVLCLAECD